MQTILITADALRPDHLAQYGYERDTMPVLDRLIERGDRFELAYANGSHTQLSVPSLLCSRYDALDQVERGPTVASVLSNEGVATAGFHSNLVLTEEFGSISGFDVLESYGDSEDVDRNPTRTNVAAARRAVRTVGERSLSAVRRILGPYLGGFETARKLYEVVEPDRFYFEPTLYARADTITDDAIRWIEARADEPFFCWIHYMEPHRPYGYSPGDPRFHDEVLSYDRMIDLMAKAGSSPGSVTDADRRAMRNLYDSDIRFMSDQIDRLLDSLESLGIRDEVGIVFSADHGEEFGEHGLYYHRNRPYEELVRVPLVCDLPELTSVDTAEPRTLLDLAPTILDQYGVRIPDEFVGRPLDGPGTRDVIAMAYRKELSIGVRDGDWKYITTESGDEELYDLRSDPGEDTDVSDANPDVCRELDDLVPADARRIAQSASRVGSDVDEDVRDRLADLGYVD